MKTLVMILSLLTCSTAFAQEPTHCQNCCLILGQIGNNGSQADLLDDEIDELLDQIDELNALFVEILNDPKYSPEQVSEAAINIRIAIDMIQTQIAVKQVQLDQLNTETHSLWGVWLASNCEGC